MLPQTARKKPRGGTLFLQRLPHFPGHRSRRSRVCSRAGISLWGRHSGKNSRLCVKSHRHPGSGCRPAPTLYAAGSAQPGGSALGTGRLLGPAFPAGIRSGRDRLAQAPAAQDGPCRRQRKGLSVFPPAPGLQGNLHRLRDLRPALSGRRHPAGARPRRIRPFLHGPSAGKMHRLRDLRGCLSGKGPAGSCPGPHGCSCSPPPARRRRGSLSPMRRAGPRRDRLRPVRPLPRGTGLFLKRCSYLCKWTPPVLQGLCARCRGEQGCF